MAFSDITPFKEPRPVSGFEWRTTLLTATIPRGQRWRFDTEISRFLRYCEVLAVPVTVPRSREYLSRIPLVSARPVARQALRWFFKAARAAERCRDGDAGLPNVLPPCSRDGFATYRRVS